MKRSPLADSNRGPLPYHALSAAMGGGWKRRFAGTMRTASTPRFAYGCHRLRLLVSTSAPCWAAFGCDRKPPVGREVELLLLGVCPALARARRARPPTTTRSTLLTGRAALPRPRRRKQAQAWGVERRHVAGGRRLPSTTFPSEPRSAVRTARRRSRAASCLRM